MMATSAESLRPAALEVRLRTLGTDDWHAASLVNLAENQVIIIMDTPLAEGAKLELDMRPHVHLHGVARAQTVNAIQNGFEVHCQWLRQQRF